MAEGPVLRVLMVLWVLLKITFFNIVAFLYNLVPWSLVPMKDVTGEVVLITGGGMGIGRLMCLAFAELGSIVVIWDINGPAAEAVVKEIKAKGGKAYSYVVDCSDNEAIYAAADKVRRDVGHVTILINNAGIVTGRKFIDCPDRLIKKTMDVNINAHFWTLKAFLPHMTEKNHGHVVTIASLAGFFGGSGLVDYCASKFAAVGLDDALYNELQYTGKTGVKCTVVCPYYINTGMFDGVKLERSKFLEPDFVVKKIMLGVRSDQRMCVIPAALKIFPMLKSLFSSRALLAYYEAGGIQEAMDTFRGRAGGKQD